MDVYGTRNTDSRELPRVVELDDVAVLDVGAGRKDEPARVEAHDGGVAFSQRDGAQPQALVEEQRGTRRRQAVSGTG